MLWCVILGRWSSLGVVFVLLGSGELIQDKYLCYPQLQLEFPAREN